MKSESKYKIQEAVGATLAVALKYLRPVPLAFVLRVLLLTCWGISG